MEVSFAGESTRTSYAYDALGRLVEIRNSSMGSVRVPRAGGDVPSPTRGAEPLSVGSKENTPGQGSALSVVQYSYDKLGRLSSKSMGDGTKVLYSYDTRGNVAGMNVVKNGRTLTGVSYEWDKAGELVKRTWDGVEQRYSYDAAGQLLKVENTAINPRESAPSAGLPPNESYTYDIAGNMIEKEVGGKKSLMTYDLANRLTRITEEVSLAKDAKDAKVTKGDLVQNSEKESELSVTSAVKTIEFGYDAMGRMVSKKVDGKETRYEYGIFNKVSRIIKPDNTVVEYDYNPLAQIAAKRLRGAHAPPRATGGAPASVPESGADKKESLSDSASPREAYLWDGLALLQKGNERYAVEPHASGGTPMTIETTKDTKSTKGDLVQNAANAAENREPASDNHAPSVFITDFLGTTLGTVTGDTFTATRLTAFGERITTEVTENTGGKEILSAVSSSNTENRQPGTDNHASSVFYTGKHYDADLEAYNFLFRNYQPGTSRWTAADPSGFPDGANNWVYVNNGVMRKMDPLGLEEAPVVDSVAQAREHWRNGNGAPAQIGPNTIQDIQSSSGFQDLVYRIQTQRLQGLLSGVSRRQEGGELPYDPQVRGPADIGFVNNVLGRTSVSYSDSTSWTAVTGWHQEPSGNWGRWIVGTTTMNVSVSDVWNFTPNPGDSWVTTLLQETIPSWIAGNGTEYTISGNFNYEFETYVFQPE